jgi:tetratricopeptide (TPR) repeat protein
MDPGDAAAMFLRALGVAGRDIPTEGLERFVMLRTLLADRRVLLLLDNAFSVEQVRPLLPGGASCLVLVTSRDSLAGLVARDGARRLELDLLPVTDAVALLRSLIGARVVADPSVATALAQRCGRLPLALRVAAELALARSETSLADLVDELADERQRLDLLDAGGDQRSAVRAVFSWSYRQLPVDVGRAFRLIGVHPGVDFDAPALAALADTSGRDARRIIGALHRAHLVVRAQRDRYAMHDLLRDYARELAMEKDPPPVRRAALTRLYDYCRCAAALAVDVLFPAERRRRPTVPVPAHRVPEFGDRAAATVWLDAELANLEAVSADAAGNGWPAHATDLAAILQRYLQVGAHHREALAIYEHALQAARGSGDTHGEATALTNLGIVHGSCGRLDQAAEWYERALPVLAGSGDLVGEARALFNIGVVKDRQGFDHSAIDYYQRSLKTFRQADDRTGEAAALGGIGNLLRRQGRLADSVALSRQALAITREVGDRLGEARQLNRLGETYAGQGDHVRSAQHHRLALAVAEDIADGARKGEAHYGLGMAHLRQGNAALAVEHQCKALALCDETGESYGRMLVLNGLGEALRALGRTREAVGYHAEALELATAGGNWTEQDRARAGLACGRSAAVDRARMPGSSDRDA